MGRRSGHHCYDPACGCGRSRAVAKAKEFVDRIRAETVCAHCGKQPIDWHHPDHPKTPYHRISRMRGLGRPIETIQKEMERCTPLCRSCHMKEDGRTTALRLAALKAPSRKGIPTGRTVPEFRPCEACGSMTSFYARGCCKKCYWKLFMVGRRAVPMDQTNAILEAAKAQGSI